MENRINRIVEGGILLALASVLSMVSLFKMPQGGSISPASMAPIILYSMRYGIKSGSVLGGLYGFIQFLISPYFLSPVQFLMDYILAYGALGLAGIVKDRGLGVFSILKASLLSMSMRTFFHVVAGVVFFSEYAGAQNPWIYSLIYNLSYMVPELAITVSFLIVSIKPLKNIFD